MNVCGNVPARLAANAPDAAAIGQLYPRQQRVRRVAPVESTRHSTHTVTPRRSWTRVDTGASVVRIFCLQGNAQ
ncbi:conserved hypothetical protein [Xanthomonas phaseoli pv. phaseoli]|uniref:Uncharacterized protein n=1 Tax=Xanthomonas campestris pv. phaseoli TaxID=317013 RepID=A0AB38DZ81_XANCH|nr:conserved hypothetical protein [Xanthomonas phaseoli pv. phaseoli]SON83734.1 conserved hypothetical protein [Xanthomonas phaseoli pv. phaseoli]SON88196.1 conserved hypothetical protein [Xanthomonas phaseoli pv. phaseoli]